MILRKSVSKAKKEDVKNDLPMVLSPEIRFISFMTLSVFPRTAPNFENSHKPC